MDAIERWTVTVVYWFLFTLLFLPVWLVLFVVLMGLVALEVPEEVTAAVAFIFVGALEVGIHRVAAKAAARRVNGGQFIDSMSGGAAEARLELSFLPVVGRLFARKAPVDSQ